MPTSERPEMSGMPDPTSELVKLQEEFKQYVEEILPEAQAHADDMAAGSMETIMESAAKLAQEIDGFMSIAVAKQLESLEKNSGPANQDITEMQVRGLREKFSALQKTVENSFGNGPETPEP